MIKIPAHFFIFSLCLFGFMPVSTAADNESEIQTPILIPKIIGGEAVKDNGYPWMARVVSTSPQLVFDDYCGGSLINEEWVLTAAHCISGDSSYVILNRNDLTDESSGLRVEVAERIIHEKYTQADSSNDIALLRLLEKVPLDVVSDYASLADTNAFETNAYPGALLTTIGWGLTSLDGEQSTTLQEVQLPIYAQDDCQNSHPNLEGVTNLFCAGFPEGGKDACVGDSGGPLFYELDGKPFVTGIVSASYGECAEPNVPGLYTKVDQYQDWITEKLTDTDEILALESTKAKVLFQEKDTVRFFTIDVPAGAMVVAETSGGIGDGDLYTKFDGEANLNDWSCRPFILGNNEVCQARAVRDSTFIVGVHAYTEFRGLQLTLTVFESNSADGSTSILDNLSGDADSSSLFSIEVTKSIVALKFTTSGGAGDVDLYVKHDQQATDTVFDCRPYKNGNHESCVFEKPSTGTWHITLRGYRAYDNVRLKAELLTSTP